MYRFGLGLLVVLLSGCGTIPSIRDFKPLFISKGDKPPVDSDFQDGEVRVTSLGTSSLLFNDGTTRFMLDGFITRPRLSLIQNVTRPLRTDTARVNAALRDIGVDSLHAVLVAHTHYDHALDAPYVALRTGARLYGSRSTLYVGEGEGVPCDRRIPLTPGVPLHFGDFRVTPLASQHGPQRTVVRWAIQGRVREPLAQPAVATSYKEGASYDFLIQHGDLKILVKPSAGFIPGALADVRAHVVFLGIGGLGRQRDDDRRMYYEETVGSVQPKLVVPIHWDDFTRPLTNALVPLPSYKDRLDVTLQFLRDRAAEDTVRLLLLQGFDAISLVGSEFERHQPRH